MTVGATVTPSPDDAPGGLGDVASDETGVAPMVVEDLPSGVGLEAPSEEAQQESMDAVAKAVDEEEDPEEEDAFSFKSTMYRLQPFRTGIWTWLPKYDLSNLKGDVISGLSVGVMLVPQGMAHSAIANLPPIMGLYAALLPIIVYACLGSSKHLAPGSGALVALLIGSSLERVPKPVALLGDGCDISSSSMKNASLAMRNDDAWDLRVLQYAKELHFYCDRCFHQCWDGGKDEFRYDWVILNDAEDFTWGTDLERCIDLCLADSKINASLILSLFSGLTLVIMGLLNFGYVVNFFSGPVLNGFTCAGGVIIGLGQLKNLFGLDKLKHAEACGKMFGADSWHCATPRAYVTLSRFFYSLDTTNWVAITLGLGMMGLLHFFKTRKGGWGKRKEKRYKIAKIVADFAALWVVLISTLTMYGAKELGGNGGVDLVGEIPKGLPSPHVPDYLESTEMLSIMVDGVMIGLLSFLASMAVAWKFARRDGYEVYPNQELAALGFACLAASLTVAFPVQGSLSRTAVNAQNAKTQLASLITASVVALALVAITSLLYYLPKTALAAIILMAIRELIDYESAMRLKKRRQYSELFVFMVAFFSTLIFGVLYGLLISVICSVLQLVQRSTSPPIKELGRVKGHRVYRNVNLHYTSREPDVLIIRFEGPLFFANSSFFHDKVTILVQRAMKDRAIKTLVFDAAAISDIDSSALTMLMTMLREYKKESVKILWSNLTARVRQAFFLGGVVELLGQESFFVDLHSAVTNDSQNKMVLFKAAANATVQIEAEKKDKEKGAEPAARISQGTGMSILNRNMGMETEWMENSESENTKKSAVGAAATNVKNNVKGFYGKNKTKMTTSFISPKAEGDNPASAASTS